MKQIIIDREYKVLFIQDNQRKISLLSYEGKPAIKTFDNFRILKNKIRSLPHPIKVIINSELINKFKLFL